jgi:hypothetical protein
MVCSHLRRVDVNYASQRSSQGAKSELKSHQKAHLLWALIDLRTTEKEVSQKVKINGIDLIVEMHIAIANRTLRLKDSPL